VYFDRDDSLYIPPGENTKSSTPPRSKRKRAKISPGPVLAEIDSRTISMLEGLKYLKEKPEVEKIPHKRTFNIKNIFTAFLSQTRTWSVKNLEEYCANSIMKGKILKSEMKERRQERTRILQNGKLNLRQLDRVGKIERELKNLEKKYNAERENFRLAQFVIKKREKQSREKCD